VQWRLRETRYQAFEISHGETQMAAPPHSVPQNAQGQRCPQTVRIEAGCKQGLSTPAIAQFPVDRIGLLIEEVRRGGPLVDCMSRRFTLTKNDCSQNFNKSFNCGPLPFDRLMAGKLRAGNTERRTQKKSVYHCEATVAPKQSQLPGLLPPSLIAMAGQVAQGVARDDQ